MTTVVKRGTKTSSIRRALNKVKQQKTFDAHKHCGAVKLKEDPLAIQKKLRDEWK